MKYAITVDIGGTNIKFAFVDTKGIIHNFSTVSTTSLLNFSELIHNVQKSYQNFKKKKKLKKRDFSGVGIGFPGPVDRKKGRLIHATNIKDWNNINAGQMINKIFDLPFYVENDANLAGLGEYWRGNGRGYNYILMLTIGTGVGGAVIINGKIYNGAQGFAPELGHITIDRKGPKCNCGNRGCLECFVSAIGIRRILSRELPKYDSSNLLDRINGDLNNFSPKLLFELANKNDKLSLEILTKIGKYLGIGIASLVNIFNPEIVLLGGGIINAKKYILPVVKKELSERAFDVMTSKLKIKSAKHSEKAGIYGAAKMVFSG